MNPRRAAQVYYESGSSFGSGYLITKSLILTALHNFAESRPPPCRDCQILLLDDAERHHDWRKGKLIWPADRQWADCSSLDLALVRIKEDARTAELADYPPILFGLPPIQDQTEDIKCSACGYPAAKKFNNDKREIWLIKGETNLVSGSVEGLLHVGLASEEALQPGLRYGETKDWVGFSGSALFAGERLIGVVKAAETEHRTLRVVRINRAFALNGFRRLVGSLEVMAGSTANPGGIIARVDDAGVLPVRPRSVIDIRRPRWTEDEIGYLRKLLLTCRSFRDPQTRGAIVAQLEGKSTARVVRHKDAELDAAAIVKAAVATADGLSVLLRCLSPYEEGSREWQELVWGLIDLKKPVFELALLRRLAALGVDLQLSDRTRLALFDQAAAELPDTQFEPPKTWQDAVVLLADFSSNEGRPALISLAQHMHDAAKRSMKRLLTDWIGDAAKAVAHHPSHWDRSSPARLPQPSAGDAFLVFEISAGVVQPGKGYSAWAFLWAGDDVETRGSAECEDERELRRWIESHLNEVGQLLRGTKPTLEFVLPDEMLAYEVDRWSEYCEDPKSTRLGLLYRLIVRSQRRVRDPRAARHWPEWENWWRRLSEGPCSGMRWIGTTKGVTPEALYADLATDHPCSVGFGFAPRGRVAMDLFDRALRAGAPVMIWARRMVANDVATRKELQELVTGDVHELPQRVLQRRLAAAKKNKTNDLGNYLSLLWDDPSRTANRVHDGSLTNRSLR
jgi:hypothetical protein